MPGDVHHCSLIFWKIFTQVTTTKLSYQRFILFWVCNLINCVFVWFHSWRLLPSLSLSLWTWRRASVTRWGAWRPDLDSRSQKLETWTLMDTQVILLFGNCKSADVHGIYLFTFIFMHKIFGIDVFVHVQVIQKYFL